MSRYAIGVFVSLFIVAALVAQSAPGTVRGILVDANNKVVPHAVVLLLARGVNRTTRTGTDGTFVFRMVVPGRYTITATLASATTSQTIEVQGKNATSLTLTLPVAQPVSIPVPPPPGRNAPISRPNLDANSAQRQIEAGVVGGFAGGVLGGFAAPAPAFAFAASPAFNTEAYDLIADNQWHTATQSPLSTFSADVDTASYSNIRRFLNLGQAPPKDAVRIEELINYFPFNYAEPEDGSPFSVTTAIGACPWAPSHRLALIGLQAKRIDSSRLPPRNLVFLIDVSGSMYDPHKLPLVKASLAMLARNLTEKDRVAIVVYAGRQGLALPSTAGSDTPTILNALHQLDAGGSTNGGAGIELAYKVAGDHFIKGGVNRVILATDGDFNVGITDQGSLLRLIEEKRRSGIALSVLGYGMGNLKDSMMVKLADAGNGNYAYIDSLNEAQKVLVEQAGGTLVTVAKDVKLQVEFNPRIVGAYRLIGYEKRVLEAQDFNNDKKDAGDIGAGHSVTALYERAPVGERISDLAIDPLKYQATATAAAAGQAEAMTVKIRYKAPESDVSTLMTSPVADRTVMTPALGFAAAIAEFGMLLRDSEFKGSSSFAQTLALASQFKGDDPHGHRAEFIRLIGAAEGIGNLQNSGTK